MVLTQEFGHGPEPAVVVEVSHKIMPDVRTFGPAAKFCDACSRAIADDESAHGFWARTVARHPVMMIGTSTPSGEYDHRQHWVRLCAECCPSCKASAERDLVEAADVMARFERPSGVKVNVSFEDCETPF